MARFGQSCRQEVLDKLQPESSWALAESEISTQKAEYPNTRIPEYPNTQIPSLTSLIFLVYHCHDDLITRDLQYPNLTPLPLVYTLDEYGPLNASLQSPLQQDVPSR